MPKSPTLLQLRHQEVRVLAVVLVVSHLQQREVVQVAARVVVVRVGTLQPREPRAVAVAVRIR